MLLLLRPSPGAAATLLAVLHLATTGIAAASLFVAADAITRGELDFQFDDFVPLLIRAVALGNGQQFAQAATGIELRRRRRLILGRIFGIWIIHWKQKSGARP